ncbi:MAG: hypothetical protein Q4G04_00810 [bacterium]|nr:hypothetical protein [bacterium]
MDENKSSNKGLYVIIIILLIIVIAMVGYIGYKSLFEKGQDNSKSDNGDIVDNTKKVDYMEIFTTQEELENLVGLTNKYSFGELLSLVRVTKHSDISNQMKLWVAIGYLDQTNDWNGFPNTITSQEIELAFNKTALSNMGLNHEDILCEIAYYWPDESSTAKHIMYTYDESTGVYTYNHGGHGGEGTLFPYTCKMTNFDINDNKYKIAYKCVWSSGSAFGNGDDLIYGAANRETLISKIGDASSDFDNLVDIYFEENYETIKDKLSTYTYTFEKTDNGYKLIDYIVE